MPLLTDSQSIAANTTVDNILDGKTHEFLPFNSMIQIAMTGGGSDVFVTAHVGSSLLIDGQEISDGTTFPVIPDDVLVTDAGREGERLVVKVENRNAAARTVRTRINVTPIPGSTKRRR